jgi:hypothetical protein
MLRVCRSNELSPKDFGEFWLLSQSACRLDGDALGWLPTPAYEQRHAMGQIHTIWRNDDCVGYCLWADVGRILHIYSCWIRRDARMIEHGRRLVQKVEGAARARGCESIKLWCAEDLPANSFWAQLMFRPLNWRHGGLVKGRRHIQWRRPVAQLTDDRRAAIVA